MAFRTGWRIASISLFFYLSLNQSGNMGCGMRRLPLTEKTFATLPEPERENNRPKYIGSLVFAASGGSGASRSLIVTNE
jgi:hypothetical protein